MTQQLASGELFAGVGGLGMAVDEVFGSTPKFFCEFDRAPSKVLAHRYPAIPNLGDVSKVNWHMTPRVNILAGGFPCQDVSLAGRRAGMKDGTRSGLWAEYLKAVTALRPDWVVIENVRGLYSARADSEMEPCPWCLGDGADEYHLRALDAVLADLSAIGFDADWIGIRAADIGAPHGRFRVFILAWPSERTVTHPSGSGSGRRAEGQEPARSDDASLRSDQGRDGGRGNQRLALLPTPEAKLSTSGPDYARMSRDGSGGDDLTTTLWREGLHLLPTTTTKDADASGGSIPANKTLTDAIVRTGEVMLLPTPNVAMAEGGQTSRSGERKGELLLGGIAVDVAMKLLPTPNTMEHLPVREGEARERAFKRGDMNGSMRAQAGNLRERVVEELVGTLLPTPTGSEGEKGGPNQAYGSGGATLSGTIPHLTGWGPYEAAIRLWETITGRPAPAPVRFDGKGGKPRLNPELTEWMMGWLTGWVTDPAIGLTRAEQLKACGNGVVPQQAAAALRLLLARPGVPDVERKDAA